MPGNMPESKGDEHATAMAMAKPFPESITYDTNTNTTTTAEHNSTSESTSRHSRRHSARSVVVTIDPHILELMNTDDDDHTQQQHRRKTYLCCGFMCDVLRACVILDGLYIFLSILHVISSVFQIPFMVAYDLNQSASFDDDTNTNIDNDNDDVFHNNHNYDNQFAIIGDIDTRGKFALLRMVLSIVFGAIGIYGAAKFRKNLVLATAVWYAIYLLTNAFERKVIAMFWGFAAYPHVALFLALRSGTITRENYDNTEKHCCCGGCIVGGNGNFGSDDVES